MTYLARLIAVIGNNVVSLVGILRAQEGIRVIPRRKGCGRSDSKSGLAPEQLARRSRR
jgi:hypothetical protein